jgi:phosphate transport system permease protein
MGRSVVLNRLGVGLAWVAGLSLVAIVISIVVWLGWNGISTLDWGFLSGDPSPGTIEEGVLGGIRAPLVGTLLVVAIGLAIALPISLGTAVFLAEYRRPAWLARIVEQGVELLFGIPSVVFALFGLAVFTGSWATFLSSEVGSSGKAYGQSFIVAGAMMALIGIPPLTRAIEESIRAIPDDLREASYALGKGRLATIRRIVLPGARPGIATGLILGGGKIAGDTAIVWLLLGGVITPEISNWYSPDRWLDTLQGTGATLTTYIYFASPVGEGNSPEAAYGAAFVLILLMVLVNGAVLYASRKGGWKR